jgi:sulfonate transport system substrate-binding protein
MKASLPGPYRFHGPVKGVSFNDGVATCNDCHWAWPDDGAWNASGSRGALWLGLECESPLRIAVNMGTIESIPVFLAAERLSSVPLRMSCGSIRDLVAGRADLATNAETQLLRYSVSHPSLRLLLTITEASYRLVFTRHPTRTALSDLRGARIATVPQTSAHYFTTRVLRDWGLDERDVTIVRAAPATTPALLKRHMVDAVALWEPWAELSVRLAGQEPVSVVQARHLYREHFCLYTTTAVLNTAGKEREIAALIDALVEGATMLSSNLAEHRALASRYLQVGESIIQSVSDQFRFRATIPPGLIDLLYEEEKWLAAIQSRPSRSRASLATLIDRRFVCRQAEILD